MSEPYFKFSKHVAIASSILAMSWYLFFSSPIVPHVEAHSRWQQPTKMWWLLLPIPENERNSCSPLHWQWVGRHNPNWWELIKDHLAKDHLKPGARPGKTFFCQFWSLYISVDQLRLKHWWGWWNVGTQNWFTGRKLQSSQHATGQKLGGVLDNLLTCKDFFFIWLPSLPSGGQKYSISQ